MLATIRLRQKLFLARPKQKKIYFLQALQLISAVHLLNRSRLNLYIVRSILTKTDSWIGIILYLGIFALFGGCDMHLLKR